MAFYEITFSPTGGTKKAADFLKAGLSKITEEIDLCDREADLAEYPFTPGDVALIAVPSYGGCGGTLHRPSGSSGQTG